MKLPCTYGWKREICTFIRQPFFLSQPPKLKNVDPVFIYFLIWLPFSSGVPVSSAYDKESFQNA